MTVLMVWMTDFFTLCAGVFAVTVFVAVAVGVMKSFSVETLEMAATVIAVCASTVVGAVDEESITAFVEMGSSTFTAMAAPIATLRARRGRKVTAALSMAAQSTGGSCGCRSPGSPGRPGRTAHP